MVTDSGSDGALVAEQKPRGKSRRRNIAGWSAVALWGLSIILSFSIPPSSQYIWVPDSVLLVGFFPLIWICPFSLVWLAFGILTAFIGSFLLLLTNIPDTALPLETVAIKKHLALYHPYWSWILAGLFVTICGAIRLTINVWLLLMRKKQPAK